MSHLIALLLSLSLVSCQPILLPESPSEQLIIDEPSGHVTTVPLDIPMSIHIPTHMSRGERMTMSTPGFRIGDINEPIEIIPPPIGNWVETPDAGQAVQATEITTINNTTHPNLNRTNTTTSTPPHTDEGIIANNPWSAMTGINVTIETPNTTTTPSPTWVDIQSEREHRAQRPAGFQMPNMTQPSFNLTIHGNLTSFNLTVHNMTSNHSRVGGMEGWMLTPGGGESYITGNITGSPINMSIIAPNTSVIITTNPNGTVTVHTNITTPTSEPTSTPTPTPTPLPSHNPVETKSSARLDTSMDFSLVISILLSCVVLY